MLPRAYMTAKPLVVNTVSPVTFDQPANLFGDDGFYINVGVTGGGVDVRSAAGWTYRLNGGEPVTIQASVIIGTANIRLGFDLENPQAGEVYTVSYDSTVADEFNGVWDENGLNLSSLFDLPVTNHLT